jgi:hypothetical protein
MAPFSERAPSLAQALSTAHAQGLGILAITGLFSGHLEAGTAIENVLRHPFVDSLTVGTINPAHLREAVTAAEKVLP